MLIYPIMCVWHINNDYIVTYLTLWRSLLPYPSVRVPRCQKLQWRFNPIWQRLLYSCTHMATVGVKGSTYHDHANSLHDAGE